MSSDKSPTAEKVDHGRCLCGAVTFTVVGEPIYNVVCHCENCRERRNEDVGKKSNIDQPSREKEKLTSSFRNTRQGGSTLHCASIFPKNQYTLHTGSEHITTYADHATQSGLPLSRAFCKICGSKVYSLTPLNDDIVSLPAGVLDGITTNWVPHKEQFCDVRCAWVPEDLGGEGVRERFKKGPMGERVEAGPGKL
ncbi:Glutathione-dependent formaldehyde-activating family GFA [Fonsecaea pedrosoi]|nr:Glutathione-dependent formaldehyde-activating family GFA [Fonsecaea pedrosoi]